MIKIDLTNIREIALANNEIHIDKRIDSEELQGGCRMLYGSYHSFFPPHTVKHGYWHRGNKYDGQMYDHYISHFVDAEWITLYPKSWGGVNSFTYEIRSDGNCFKRFNFTSEKIDVKNTEVSQLICEVVRQLHSFNKRHNIDLYDEDIQMLRGYLNKYPNEILEIDLNKS